MSDNKPSRGSRFNLWVALTAFSIVVLAAVVNETKDGRTRTQKWAVSVAAVSLSLAFLACLAHGFVPKRFSGTALEAGLAVIILGFWAAGLPGIMNPKTMIAIQVPDFNDFPKIQYTLNANAYFFSWASFITVTALAGSFAYDLVEVCCPEKAVKRSLSWLGLCASSFVVMASGSRLFYNAKCSTILQYVAADGCERLEGAIAAGTISAIMGLVMTIASHIMPALVEAIIGVVMIIMWCFVVSYITFGTKAPGPVVSNLYFSTWAAFIFTLFVTSGAFTDMFTEESSDDGIEGTSGPSTTVKETRAAAPAEVDPENVAQ